MIISVLRAIVSLLLNSCSYLIDYLWLSLCYKHSTSVPFLIVLIQLTTYDYLCFETSLLFFLFVWTLIIIFILKATVSLFLFYLFLFDWSLMVISVLRTTVPLFLFYCSYLINFVMIIFSWEQQHHYSFFFSFD